MPREIQQTTPGKTPGRKDRQMFGPPIIIREPKGQYQLTIQLSTDESTPILVTIQPQQNAPEWARQIGTIFLDGTLDSILETLVKNAINASSDH